MILASDSDSDMDSCSGWYAGAVGPEKDWFDKFDGDWDPMFFSDEEEMKEDEALEEKSFFLDGGNVVYTVVDGEVEGMMKDLTEELSNTHMFSTTELEDIKAAVKEAIDTSQNDMKLESRAPTKSKSRNARLRKPKKPIPVATPKTMTGTFDCTPKVCKKCLLLRSSTTLSRNHSTKFL